MTTRSLSRDRGIRINADYAGIKEPSLPLPLRPFPGRSLRASYVFSRALKYLAYTSVFSRSLFSTGDQLLRFPASGCATRKNQLNSTPEIKFGAALVGRRFDGFGDFFRFFPR